ncbi:MAG: hypothetical protein M9910_02070 [Kiritimatiellae bacterium]|nr:hypothetical protein [Kiritimatiellia bacterium]
MFERLADIRIRRAWRVTAVLATLWSCALLPALAARTDPFDAGFLASRHRDAHGDQRLKVAGPFFEAAQSTQGWHLVAFRPFYSKVEDPANDRARQDYLWPLGSSRTIGPEEQTRILIFFSFKHGEDRPERRHRFWLLPFYFSGRDAQGDTYRAVFPFGGTIREFLGRDEISFVLFPLRSTSKLNDLETSNWLWPFISKTTGSKVERERVFPFYGRSYREGQYEKHFVMWPLWTDVEYFYPGSSGKGFILFPLYGHTKLEDQETWMLIPPFFRYTKGDKATRLFAPWPFIQRETGDVEKFYLWPLWGHRAQGKTETTFYLWPIVWDQTSMRGDVRQDRFIVAPFYFHFREGITNEPPQKREVKVWPLFSYRRAGEDSFFRTLALWPLADYSAVERNWAPLWTLYSSSRHEDSVDRELLWGLHRDLKRGDEERRWSLFPLWDWHRESDGKSWSFLKGLLGRSRNDSNVEWRVLFFFKFGDKPEQEIEP